MRAPQLVAGTMLVAAVLQLVQVGVAGGKWDNTYGKKGSLNTNFNSEGNFA